VYDFFMHRMKSGTGGWENELLLVGSMVVRSEVGGVKLMSVVHPQQRFEKHSLGVCCYDKRINTVFSKLLRARHRSHIAC
jgi:hypothetical protein